MRSHAQCDETQVLESSTTSTLRSFALGLKSTWPRPWCFFLLGHAKCMPESIGDSVAEEWWRRLGKPLLKEMLCMQYARANAMCAVKKVFSTIPFDTVSSKKPPYKCRKQPGFVGSPGYIHHIISRLRNHEETIAKDAAPSKQRCSGPFFTKIKNT